MGERSASRASSTALRAGPLEGTVLARPGQVVAFGTDLGAAIAHAVPPEWEAAWAEADAQVGDLLSLPRDECDGAER